MIEPGRTIINQMARIEDGHAWTTGRTKSSFSLAACVPSRPPMVSEHACPISTDVSCSARVRFASGSRTVQIPRWPRLSGSSKRARVTRPRRPPPSSGCRRSPVVVGSLVLATPRPLETWPGRRSARRRERSGCSPTASGWVAGLADHGRHGQIQAAGRTAEALEAVALVEGLGRVVLGVHDYRHRAQLGVQPGAACERVG